MTLMFVYTRNRERGAVLLLLLLLLLLIPRARQAAQRYNTSSPGARTLAVTALARGRRSCWV